jgi:23S rRNA (guanosine2251-2'-O)-methyltransferase
MPVVLRNPHSVLAVLKQRASDVLEVKLPAGKPSPAWGEVANLAKLAGVPVRTQLGGVKPTLSGKSDLGRQSVTEATIKEKQPLGVEELLALEGSEEHGVWLALDCLQDPHNVGAIFRTAGFFGVRGIIVTKDRSAPLSGIAYDVAAGGLEMVPHAQPSNLARAIETAKQNGIWVLGTSEHESRPVSQIARDRPWLVVVGNEEQGLRRLTLDSCDDRCGIPALGPVSSLNVSVATGVLLAALARKI